MSGTDQAKDFLFSRTNGGGCGERFKLCLRIARLPSCLAGQSEEVLGECQCFACLVFYLQRQIKQGQTEGAAFQKWAEKLFGGGQPNGLFDNMQGLMNFVLNLEDKLN